MASFNKYQTFIGDLENKVHDLLGTGGSTADTLKVLLSNTAPNAATNLVKADAAEIGAGNGYSAGGSSVTNVGANSSGTVNVTGTTVVFTAAGGTVGPFRYVILYNSTASGGPLIGWWDYGSSVTLNDTETFTVAFGTNILSSS